MKVKHKKGQFRPSLFSGILITTYILIQKIIGRPLRFRVSFSDNSFYKSEDPEDWLKILGTGSWNMWQGVHKDERLAVWRCHDGFFQIALDYQRGHYIKTLPSVVMNLKHGEWSPIMEVGNIYPKPLMPWAGGDKPIDRDIEYQIQLYF